MKRRHLLALLTAALAALLVVPTALARPTADCGGADVCIGDSWQAKLDSPAALDGVLTLEAGTHPGQQIQADPTRLQPVTFVPVGGPVYVSGGQFGPSLWLGSTDYRQTRGPSNLIFRDIHFGTPTRPLEVFAYPGTTDVTFDNVTMGRHNFTAVTRVILENSDIGPWHDAVSFVKNAAGQPASLDVQLLHNVYHDNTVINPANHAECEYNWGTRNLLIEGNVFENCTDIGIFSAGQNPGIVIRNNFIDVPMPGVTNTFLCNPNCGKRAGYSIQFKGDGTTQYPATVEFNSMLGPTNWTPASTSMTFRGNAVGCGSFNGCAVPPSFFVDPITIDGTMDLHLVMGAPQIDSQDTGPPFDIDGQARPIGPKFDAGADEFGTVTPPPPPPPPPPPDDPPLFNGGLTSGAITTTVIIGWKAAIDDVMLKGYRLYRDGTFLSTAGPAAVKAKFGISCGSHVFKVEAYDSKDQRSAQTINLIRNC